ncbi:hypothetical protein ACQPU1_05455 [Clostridium paraputrificum]|uniref:hypothetical protein n=1 Tax=Clostridium paraputrificum TaxID=29363 RepID=UPI003D32A2A7
MSKRKIKPIRVIILVCIIGICITLYIKNFANEKGLRVTAWDNIYNENNITLFYEEGKDNNKSLQSMNSTYKINEILSKENKEIEKVLQSVDILHSIVSYDDVADSLSSDGYGILKEKGESTKVSGRDMAIIERDILLSAGITSRVGEFRKEEPQFQSNASYYVVEYWSDNYNKWVMIDFKDRGYLDKDGVPLSAIEIIGEDLKNLTYIGKSAQNTYRKEIKKYLYSYTIPIDNSLSMKRSNSYITYASTEKSIDLINEGRFIPATIYTTSKDLFLKSPKAEATGNDSKAYLLLMKKPMESNQDYTYIVGGFKDGKVMRDYYLRVNDGEMEKVDMYHDLELKIGDTKIELSLDGTNVVSKVELVRDK